MVSSVRSQPRPMLVNAARTLMADAQLERARWPMDASARQFYLGVDAAALEVLHPELGSARTEEWLERQPAAFREGYVRTSTMIVMVNRESERVVRFPLPEWR